jgi:hypothetical protein
MIFFCRQLSNVTKKKKQRIIDDDDSDEEEDEDEDGKANLIFINLTNPYKSSQNSSVLSDMISKILAYFVKD